MKMIEDSDAPDIFFFLGKMQGWGKTQRIAPNGLSAIFFFWLGGEGEAGGGISN